MTEHFFVYKWAQVRDVHGGNFIAQEICSWHKLRCYAKSNAEWLKRQTSDPFVRILVSDPIQCTQEEASSLVGKHWETPVLEAFPSLQKYFLV
jgi:hypothetical protein